MPAKPGRKALVHSWERCTLGCRTAKRQAHLHTTFRAFKLVQARCNNLNLLLRSIGQKYVVEIQEKLNMCSHRWQVIARSSGSSKAKLGFLIRECFKRPMSRRTWHLKSNLTSNKLSSEVRLRDAPSTWWKPSSNRSQASTCPILSLPISESWLDSRLA